MAVQGARRADLPLGAHAGHGVPGVPAMSAVFTALPGWAQAVGQAFPLYWFGLGLRSAPLPDAAVAAGVGGRCGPPWTAVALGLWAVVGFALAPPLLRRTIRREPGAPVPRRPVS
ncbi:hypothetical protein ACFFSW_04775 [Saccharothrix longispora]|uniref:ABC-2 type transport system permease protein n=1 Tax=Saccharothrix longispora TaxID=33920 RepID=A0ABU1PPY4_9PSEU|nr:hypothetical protein [Saccharothrix longispora]MDR6591944.1 hypothetical protein [Saccharothrix longispora]